MDFKDLWQNNAAGSLCSSQCIVWFDFTFSFLLNIELCLCFRGDSGEEVSFVCQ